MEETIKVKPTDMRFDELMLKIRKGEIRIPDFQREFVWDQNQIISLLDSVYQHYPIGSFLFWKTKDEIQSYRRIGEVELRHDAGSSVQYVLDGQQRLTSLFASLEQATITHKVNGKKVNRKLKIFFDLDEEQFVADPFTNASERRVYQFENIRQITHTDDYLPFLVELMRYIKASSATVEQVNAWLDSRLNSRPKHFINRFQDIDLYAVVDGKIILKEAGEELLAKQSALPVIKGMVKVIKYCDLLVPKIIEDGGGEKEELVKFLADQHDVHINGWKIRCRLKWLAGLGLGAFHGQSLSLSDEGKKILDEILREKEIKEKDLTEQERDKLKRYFSVEQITDTDKFVEAAADLDSERRKALLGVQKRFNNYPFSVIDVLDQPIETACEIFERINNSGKVLDVVDLMVAKSWSPTFNLRERLSAFREELKKEHYDDVPDITILQCVAAVVQRAVNRKNILNIKAGQVEDSWEETLESIRQAIDFLKSNIKLTHAKLLPYNSVLVPLTYFFHVTKARQHSEMLIKALVEWFWQVCVSNRYDQGTDTKIGEDIAIIGQLVKDHRTRFNYLAPPLTPERVMDQYLNLGSAFCKTILCVLNNRGPVEFKNSSPVLLTSFSKFNAAELHHVFPQAYLKVHDNDHYPERDSVANIALASAKANKEYSNKAPSDYLESCGNKKLNQALESHFVDDKEASGLLDDDFETFLQYRAERIVDEMRRLTGNMAEVEAEFKGNEAKAIESFELRIRSLLDTTLRQSDSNYWQNVGTPEFRESIEMRISDWLKAHPSRNRSEAREVDFCQILEYLKIAQSCWSVFEPLFKSKKDLEMHLKNINTFRNYLMHNREMNLATRQLALGSLSWFDEVFKANGS